MSKNVWKISHPGPETVTSARRRAGNSREKPSGASRPQYSRNGRRTREESVSRAYIIIASKTETNFNGTRAKWRSLQTLAAGAACTCITRTIFASYSYPHGYSATVYIIHVIRLLPRTSWLDSVSNRGSRPPLRRTKYSLSRARSWKAVRGGGIFIITLSPRGFPRETNTGACSAEISRLCASFFVLIPRGSLISYSPRRQKPLIIKTPLAPAHPLRPPTRSPGGTRARDIAHTEQCTAIRVRVAKLFATFTLSFTGEP